MTHETESLMSLPLAISGVESISDLNSTTGITPVPDTLASCGDALFDLGDGDLRLVMHDTTLETHKYIIKRFSRLKNRIENNVITLRSDEPVAEDFRNMFRILYASVVEGPFEFDPSTLISALRIATIYDYPSLRTFAIRHLEKASLSAVDRIGLAREFGLPSWEEPAYVELCNRDEAITKQEARVLGLDAFVHVAKIREKEQRRRGKGVDAVTEGSCGLTATAKPNQNKRKKRKAKVLNLGASESGSGSDEYEEDQAREAVAETGEKPTETIPHPSFVNTEIEGDWRVCGDDTFVLQVPGCKCAPRYSGEACIISPCGAKAFKHLQTQQLAHKSNISKLETTMERVNITLLSLTAAPEPHMQSDSNEPSQTGSVQEEVRKWLTDIGSLTGIS
ncbi:hypothetical protein BDV93DRAFT_528186 [Ceratobasidium sp. AG-I]|nr:hypothetical protein BDV93DRAFT_528186 [Ceratobasidium sp. AG-I]